ncbi:MAG: putative transcriptional regulator [Natrialbaceae archaeon]|jgi:predicted transcriptional regulator
MVSRAELERLRTEADTILTRIGAIQNRLERARTSEGDHWEEGELEMTLETPEGDPIEITLDLDRDAAESAGRRYERAKEMEAELETRRAVSGPVVEVPDDVVGIRVLYHLKTVEGDYPRSIARNLDADRERVVKVCEALERAGLLERIEAGMLKRRKVKLKRSLETHQHHTYYRLSRDGDHLLRHLDERAGKADFLRRFEPVRRIARRLSNGGPDYPRMTAEDLEIPLDDVRHLYAAMGLVGLVATYDGSTIKGEERTLKPKDETHRKHTYYVTMDVTDRILREMDG